MFVFGADGEDSWKTDLQLLGCHGLQVGCEVEGRNRDFGDFLEGIDHGFLGEFEPLDTCASDDEVGVWLGGMITPNHLDIDL